MQFFNKKSSPAKPTSAPIESALIPGGATVTQLRPKTVNRMSDATRASAHRDLEVAIGSNALPESVQTAALLFANGETAMAIDNLLSGLASTTEEAHNSCWLCLLDLYVKSNQRQLFDELALKYVVRFERSAPAWDELSTVAKKLKTESQSQTQNIIEFPKECTGVQLSALKELAAVLHNKTNDLIIRVSIGQVEHIEEDAAEALRQSLIKIRRKGIVIEWSGVASILKLLRRPLNVRVQKYLQYWLLALELIQWQNDQHDFENLAIDYAVCFSISPPSWEALTSKQIGSVAQDSLQMAIQPLETDEQSMAWHGNLCGPNDPQVAKLHQIKNGKRIVVNLKEVNLIDFACAADITNGFLKIMASGSFLEIKHASPIVQALLQITGAPLNLFVKTKR